MTFSDRIRESMIYCGETNQSKFASLVRAVPGAESFSQQNLSRMLNHSPKNSLFTVQIAIATNVCPNWLATGAGHKEITSDSPEVKSIAKMIMAVDPDTRTKILHYLEVVDLFSAAEEDAENILNDRELRQGNQDG